jgi:phosphonate transport system substrate-binding protein
MTRKRLFFVLSAIAVSALILTACGGAATTAAPAPTEAPPTQAPAPTEPPPTQAPPPTEVPPTEAPTEVPLGSAEHPIKVLFVPSVDTQVIVSGGQIMADALNKATGLNFEVSVPTSYAATIEEMCASPTDTIGFIPGLGYVLANQLCGVDVAYKAVRFGFSVYWTEILVPRDSTAQTVADLDGLKWAYPDAGSTSGYMVPQVMFKNANIAPGETVEAGGHPQAVTALYNGDADFATVFYSPPLKPEGEPSWQEGDPPDIPDDLVASCAPKTPDGASSAQLWCGDWRVLDARSNIIANAPDVVQKLRIMMISPSIPNDTLSFGPDFPADLRSQIEQALVDFSKTDDWKNSIGSNDFYGWTGLDPAKDSDYDFVRQMVDLAGITLENIGG